MLTSPLLRRSDSQAQRILEMIQDGELNVGDRLPGQRELAAQLNIGRSTVREAIRSLEALGFLETRLGLGTYVVSSTPDPIENSLSVWLAANKDKVIKVFEVREALESKAAELAASNAQPDDILVMEETLNEMKHAIEAGDHTRVTEMDERFHDIIGQAAGNSLLFQMIENICSVLTEAREAVLSMSGRATRSLNEHWAIYEAIKTADPDRAKEAMIRHITNARNDIH
jgi:GntR family transcriptional regulator, transcriptional repressor for pyruvate dehydrogenase complex